MWGKTSSPPEGLGQAGGFFLKTTLVLIALAGLALAPPATGTTPAFTHDGAFLYGGLTAFYGPDACINHGLTEGIDSNCITLPPDLAGKRYAIVNIQDATGTLARDPNYDVPRDVYDPAVATCKTTAVSRFCPQSNNLLYYPLMAACFYKRDVSFATGYLEVIGCSFVGTIPEGAELVSITASGGADVKYTFTVYE